MNKNIGLFFGTFDPLHNGHIAIAKYFLKEVNLDEIWLVITPISPFKQANKLTNYYTRFKIINNYCKKNINIICSDVEFNLNPPYNTSETLMHLILQYFYLGSVTFQTIIIPNHRYRQNLFESHSQLILI